MIETGDIRPIAAAKAGSAAPNVRLSQARQAQNLTTSDIARRLKLSVWQVEALESGQYERLPGAVFVRGFIRNYARLLKLDPEELVQAASGLVAQPAPLPETVPAGDIPFPAAGSWRWRRYAAAAGSIVAVLAVYEFFFHEQPGTVATKPDPVAAAPSPQEKPQPAVSAEKPREPRPQQAAAATASSPQVARASPSGVSQQGERIVHPDEREVRLVFEQESWVEVRDRNDQPIFAQLNQAGTTRRVRGLPPLYVVVGNAQGVRMTYDGRDIDLARHTKIDVARLTLE